MNSESSPSWIRHLEFSHEGAMIIDEQLEIRFCNPVAAELIGKKPEDLIGKTFYQCFTGPLGSIDTQKPSQSIDVIGYHARGHTSPVKMRTVPIGDGQILTFLKSQYETDQTQKMMEILAKSSEVLGSSLNILTNQDQAVKIPVPILSDWAALVNFDPAGSNRLIKSHHINTEKEDQLNSFLQDNWNEVYKLFGIEKLIRSGESIKICISETDLPLFSLDSEILILPYFAKSEICGLIFLGVDSPRKFQPDDLVIAQELVIRLASAFENAALYEKARLSERELSLEKSRSDEANQAKTTYLAAMSHEIRSPLTAILGFAELMTGNDLTETERIEYSERIQNNGDHLLRLIDDVLNVAKIESGKIETEIKQAKLPQILSTIWSLHERQADKRGIDLHLDIESQLPESIITDATRLKQILSNLIGNAIKFTDQGKVELQIRFENKGQFLIFKVSDTGPGLTELQAQKIFAPFRQADPSHSRRFGGTGLGLMLSRQLARILGGDVELVSTTPGSGTVFQAVLPVKIPRDTGWFSSLSEAQQPLNISHRASELALEGLRVLLVDDSIDNSVLISRFLESEGAQVTTAFDGYEAVQRTRSHVFDLILMDVQMPNMNGIEATRKIREQGNSTPIIALTACAMSTERQKCIDAGCNAHLTKPINKSRLISSIQDFFLPEKIELSAQNLKVTSSRILN